MAKCYLSADTKRDNYFDDVKLQMDAKLWAEIYNRKHFHDKNNNNLREFKRMFYDIPVESVAITSLY